MLERFAHLKEEIAGTSLVLLLFVGASYFSQTYFTTIEGLLGRYNELGMLIYVIGAAVATVIAPLSFFPVLPIAVGLWGSFTTAALSIVAWQIGAVIAFLLARRYGQPLVARLMGEKKMEYLSQFIPKRYLFIAIVFLRMALPVDLLSYAIGLFGVMRFWPYFWATLIGITPFAFIFSYLATVSVGYQIAAFAVGILFVAISYPYMKRRYKRMFFGERLPENID